MSEQRKLEQPTADRTTRRDMMEHSSAPDVEQSCSMYSICFVSRYCLAIALSVYPVTRALMLALLELPRVDRVEHEVHLCSTQHVQDVKTRRADEYIALTPRLSHLSTIDEC